CCILCGLAPAREPLVRFAAERELKTGVRRAYRLTIASLGSRISYHEKESERQCATAAERVWSTRRARVARARRVEIDFAESTNAADPRHSSHWLWTDHPPASSEGIVRSELPEFGTGTCP